MSTVAISMRKTLLGSSDVFGKLKTLCEQGRLLAAFRIVELLDQNGGHISTNVLYNVLQACIKKKNLEVGRQLHRLIKRKVLQSSSYLGSHLIRLYAACGSLQEAREVFKQLPQPNVFAWSEIILAHTKLGYGMEAIRLYHRMRKFGVNLDSHVYVAALQACSSTNDLNQGKLIHKHAAESGFASNIYVASSLVDMYVQCGKLSDAYSVFESLTSRNIVIWNAIIAGYAQRGNLQYANQLLDCMHEDNLRPNIQTMNAVISGCAQNGHGTKAFKFVRQMQYDGMQPNHVTWNGLISGLAQYGDSDDALCAFQWMLQEGVQPNSVTFISVLKACYESTAVNNAKLIHAHIMENVCALDPVSWNTIIKMYATCGNLHDACQMFDQLPKRDVETWNSMISGYASHNMHRMAVSCFNKMVQEGLQPDDVSFTCVLSSCSHLGLISEGCKHFTAMTEKHGVSPVLEHVKCMVDLLGRSGRLMEAEDLIHCMPFQPDVEAWISLLAHCRNHSDYKLAKESYGNVVTLDDKDSAGYVLLSSIYIHIGREPD